MSHRITVIASAVALSIPALAGAQHVNGTLLDKKSNAPIQGAWVTLLPTGRGDSATVRTDSAGEFSLTGSAAGTYTLRIRKIGLVPATTHAFWLGPLTERIPTIRMETVGIALDTVKITTKGLSVTDWTQEFFDRKRITHGIFLTRDDVASRAPYQATDWLLGVRGVHMQYVAGRARIVGTRSGATCALDVYVDNLPVYDGDINMMLRAQDVAAMEVYAGGVDTPMRFRTRGCGVLLVWTYNGQDTGEVAETGAVTP